MRYSILILVLSCCVLFGCADRKGPLFDTKRQEQRMVETTKKVIKESSEQINKSADKIDSSVETVQKELPDHPVVQAHASVVRQETASLRLISGSMMSVYPIQDMLLDSIDNSHWEIKNLQKENAKLAVELERKKSQARQWLDYVFGIITVISVLSISVSVFLFMSGFKRLAISLGSTGVFSAALAVAFMNHLPHIAWIGFGFVGVSLIAIISQIVYYLYTEHKKKEVLLTGLKETIATVEEVKPHLHPETKEVVFKNMIDKIQSDTTKEMVSIEKHEGLTLHEVDAVVQTRKKDAKNEKL